MLHNAVPPLSYFEYFKKVIRNTDIESAKILLQEAKENHYELNSHDEKTHYTLLHFAISKANKNNEKEMLAILQLLKEAGSDVNQFALDSFHNTPIHTASRRALSDILKWLLQNGANPKVQDQSGQTPLDYVEKQLQCVKSHMNDSHKEKLQNIKNILSLKSNRQISNICRLGLFAVSVIGTATVVAVNRYNMTLL